VKQDALCAAYCTSIMALPQVQEWVAAAQGEHDAIDELDAEF
jgi:glutathione S-transferase